MPDTRTYASRPFGGTSQRLESHARQDRLSPDRRVSPLTVLTATLLGALAVTTSIVYLALSSID